MCFKCDVTNYSLPNSDYDTRKRKIKYSNNSLSDRRACSRLSFSDLNSFYQARADGRTLILMPDIDICFAQGNRHFTARQ